MSRKTGTYIGMEYIEQNRVLLTYELPLMKLSMISLMFSSPDPGYASFDYEFEGYKEANLLNLIY